MYQCLFICDKWTIEIDVNSKKTGLGCMRTLYHLRDYKTTLKYKCKYKTTLKYKCILKRKQ